MQRRIIITFALILAINLYGNTAFDMGFALGKAFGDKLWGNKSNSESSKAKISGYLLKENSIIIFGVDIADGINIPSDTLRWIQANITVAASELNSRFGHTYKGMGVFIVREIVKFYKKIVLKEEEVNDLLKVIQGYKDGSIIIPPDGIEWRDSNVKVFPKDFKILASAKYFIIPTVVAHNAYKVKDIGQYVVTMLIRFDLIDVKNKSFLASKMANVMEKGGDSGTIETPFIINVNQEIKKALVGLIVENIISSGDANSAMVVSREEYKESKKKKVITGKVLESNGEDIVLDIGSNIASLGQEYVIVGDSGFDKAFVRVRDVYDNRSVARVLWGSVKKGDKASYYDVSRFWLVYPGVETFSINYKFGDESETLTTIGIDIGVFFKAWDSWRFGVTFVIPVGSKSDIFKDEIGVPLSVALGMYMWEIRKTIYWSGNFNFELGIGLGTILSPNLTGDDADYNYTISTTGFEGAIYRPMIGANWRVARWCTIRAFVSYNFADKIDSSKWESSCTKEDKNGIYSTTIAINKPIEVDISGPVVGISLDLAWDTFVWVWKAITFQWGDL